MLEFWIEKKLFGPNNQNPWEGFRHGWINMVFVGQSSRIIRLLGILILGQSSCSCKKLELD